MIKTYKCIPVVERLCCDDCEVELDECQVLFTHPARYKYMCPKCRKEIITEKMYPSTSYIQVGEVDDNLDDLWSDLNV